MGVCYVFFHYLQRKVQKYFYCFLIRGSAMNCKRLRTEDSTSYCALAVISQWMLSSYIHGLVQKLHGLSHFQCRCSYHKTLCVVLLVLWTVFYVLSIFHNFRKLEFVVSDFTF
jgi:hypothetical protein